MTLLGILIGLAGCTAAPPIVERTWPNGYDAYLLHGSTVTEEVAYETVPYGTYADDWPRVTTHLYLGYGPMFLYDAPFFYYPSPWYYSSPWHYPRYRYYRAKRHRPPPYYRDHRREDRPARPPDRRPRQRDRGHGDRDRDRQARPPPNQQPRRPIPDRRPAPRSRGDGQGIRPPEPTRPSINRRAGPSNDARRDRRGNRIPARPSPTRPGRRIDRGSAGDQR
ncbi:hypothetical protein D779_3928 [Imhoffiella purpurea]|uniref:Uncharacterized protein n=1 Tax=Imhoffiella purpurea TaxID=1249627 RepID=W9VS60_9GAMM|nr:hypothetical protein D779_3928 [Imhoffiella purpurea]